MALTQAFERWSMRSRYRRFLGPHERLSATELRYFTEVDHHDHEALVALDADSGDWMGIARYIRSESDPRVAEVAFAVADERQGEGVGGQLAAALVARAREEGIASFTALALADNARVLNLLRELGDVRILRRNHGSVEVSVELGVGASEPRLKRSEVSETQRRGRLRGTRAQIHWTQRGGPRGDGIMRTRGSPAPA